MKKRRPFTKKGLNTSFANFSQPLTAGTASSKWYRSIDELPLSRFIDAAVDDNIHALVVSGNPTPEDLRSAWQVIKMQYADTMGDAEGKAMLILMREIANLEINIRLTETLIAELTLYYCEVFEKELNKLIGGSIKFDVTDDAKYEASLKRAERRSRGFKLTLDLKTIKLQEMQKKYDEKSGKPTRRYFQNILITLSEATETHLVIDNLTTYEFCERIHRLNRRNDRIKMKK